MACVILERTSVLSHHLRQYCSEVFEACNGTKLLPFYIDLHQNAIGAVCHQFLPLSTDFHPIPCADLVETFDYGF